jgi:hypothetical protein
MEKMIALRKKTNFQARYYPSKVELDNSVSISNYLREDKQRKASQSIQENLSKGTLNLLSPTIDHEDVIHEEPEKDRISAHIKNNNEDLRERAPNKKRANFFFSHRGIEEIIPKPTQNKLVISRA